MFYGNEFDEILDECEEKLQGDSAFEKLLKVLVDFGMNVDDAAQMIADCIDEQYELDGVRDKLSSVYQDAKEAIKKAAPDFDETAVLH